MTDYSQMADAYRMVYEGTNEKHNVVMPGRPPLRPLVINKTNVSVDVTEPYVVPGGVEKAYYTYPASFDPTNREDVITPSKSTKSEDTSDIEIVGDYLLEAGLVDNVDSVDAFYAHMSDEWKTQILEKADDNGNTSCWDSHKKVGMKKKGGKMVNDCVPK